MPCFHLSIAAWSVLNSILVEMHVISGALPQSRPRSASVIHFWYGLVYVHIQVQMETQLFYDDIYGMQSGSTALWKRDIYWFALGKNGSNFIWDEWKKRAKYICPNVALIIWETLRVTETHGVPNRSEIHENEVHLRWGSSLCLITRPPPPEG